MRIHIFSIYFLLYEKTYDLQYDIVYGTEKQYMIHFISLKPYIQ